MVAGFEIDRRDRSRDGREHLPDYKISAWNFGYLMLHYQKGFRTDLHGALQITGSNCNNGLSGFSLRGVYRAPMGTTRREASYDLSVRYTASRNRLSITDHSRTGENIPTEP